MRLHPSDDMRWNSPKRQECELQRHRDLREQIVRLKAVNISILPERQIDICKEIRAIYEYLRYYGGLPGEYQFQSINDLFEQIDKLKAIVTNSPKLQIAICEEIKEAHREVEILIETFFD